MGFYRPVFYINLLTGSYLLLFMIFVNLCFTGRIYSLENMPFRKLFVAYIIFIVANIISCWYFREQSMWISIKCYVPFLLIYLVPAFYQMNLDTKQWEKVIIYLWMIYLIFNFIQYIFIDTQLFHLMKEFSRMKDEMRAVVFGEGILYLGGLLCLNKYFTNKDKKFIIGYILSFLLIFLHGFRMSILGFSIVSVLLLYKLIGISRIILISSIVGVISLFLITKIPIVNNKINEIAVRSQNDNFMNEDYVRFRTFDYFHNNHFKHPIERILGSGQTYLMPKENIKYDKIQYQSKYSKQRCDLIYHYYAWSVDWGLIGLTWDSGIPFTICLIIILLSIFKTKLNRELLYINYWALFLLIIGITQPMSYAQNIFIYYAIILTIIQIEKRTLVE